MKYSLCLLFALVSFAVASAARADTMKVQLQNFGSALTIKTPAYNGGAQGNATAGLMALDHIAGPDSTGIGAASTFFVKDPTPSSSRIAAFCIDLKEVIGGGQTKYDLISVADAPNYSSGSGAMGGPRAEAIAKLWAEFINKTGSNLTVDNDDNNSARNAGFQLAVWEIVYELPANAWNVTSGGGFKAINNSTFMDSAIAEATAMFTWLTANGANAPKANLIALSAPSGTVSTAAQDLIVEYVPEPGTILSLASMALAGTIGLVIRRSSRRQSAEA